MRRSSKNNIPSAWLGLGVAAFTGLASAQATPGVVGDTLKRPMELQQPQRLPPPIQNERAEPAPADAGQKRVEIRRFEFAGNTLYTQEQLAALLAGYTNRTLSLLDIYAAADAVAEHYVADGYTLVSVNVPPQKIEGGTVRLLISEGRLAKIAVEGETSYDADQMARYLGQARPGTVYRGKALEEGLRVINTLPGLQAKAVVRPGPVYGTSELVLKLEEKPVEGVISVDNFGREDIGETRFSAFTQFNNPLGVEDQLQLLALRSEDGLLNYGFGAYSLPVNFRGTRLSLSYGYAAFELVGSPVDGANHTGRAMIEHPVLRSVSSQLTVNGGLSRTSANSDFAGNTFDQTSITLVELGGTYTHTHDSLAVTQLSANLATNFRELESSENVPATDKPGDQRLRLELDLQHLRPLGGTLQLFGRFNGVYSPDPLLDTSKFSLGGPNMLRGYPSSEVRGDRGYAAALGLRMPASLGEFLVSGRAYAEAGQVFIVDAAPGADDSEFISDLGIGVDVVYNRVTLKLDYAVPLEDEPFGIPLSDDRDNGRLYGSVAVSF